VTLADLVQQLVPLVGADIGGYAGGTRAVRRELTAAARAAVRDLVKPEALKEPLEPAPAGGNAE
jgi:hypothetical protein